jgi:hypothetical protein
MSVSTPAGRGGHETGLRAALLALLVAGLSGCGLAEYEARMRDTQARLQRFEEEDKLLGAALQVPMRVDEKTKLPVPLVNVFVRAPRGITTLPHKDVRNGLLYRYPAAKQGSAAPFTQLEVAYGRGQKKFAEKVINSFGNADREQKSRANKVRSAAGEGTTTFQTLEFVDGATGYSINLVADEKNQNQLAVIYYFKAAQRKAAERAIKLCLEWTGAGPQADKLRKAFARRSPLMGRPPPAAPPG